jgi:hypothetical protein
MECLFGIADGLAGTGGRQCTGGNRFGGRRGRQLAFLLLFLLQATLFRGLAQYAGAAAG